MSAVAPPVVPSNLQVYNSYVEDPIWQRKFTIIWCSALGFAVLVSLPTVILSIRNGQAFKGFFGISEDFGKKGYRSVAINQRPIHRSVRKVSALWNAMNSVVLWAPPKLKLNVGQIFIILAYLSAVIVCIIVDAPLISNPNRAGFLALAQFPIVFLFATKNSILGLLLGPGNGYEKLNFIHRMAGRLMFLAACIHGSLWIRNHLQYNIPILGQQKETSGVASFSLLGIIVLTSLKPVRKFFYQAFFIIHVLTYVAFFITVCYHTIYASPWIFPPLAFYGFDLLMRMFRYRIKDAVLLTPGTEMTLVHVNDCDDGWIAGQHVQLRVFFSNRVFESHPLTILSAPPSRSCLSNPGMYLAARVHGDWTRALYTYARKEHARLSQLCEKQSQDELGDASGSGPGALVQVMLDGPYGGSSVDLGRYESALLVAGGSGITFTLGLLDDIVGRCVKLDRAGGEITRRIEFAWCIRSFGYIEWFAPMLTDIANVALGSSLELHISIFVTCLCDPEAVPDIPNSIVTINKPSVYNLLNDLISPSSFSSTTSSDVEDDAAKMSSSASIEAVNPGGGVAVCASGPESMTTEAQNAVARLGVTKGVMMGGIALHTELFTL
ncbi:iron reductase [Hygrophoropsis aurantiaca]|uniref:Iron reductase n=1 Tax=Hygrophoropsis aurantiaca TaxID=72124 RepID=A0ACB8AF54_9AGAM|nr:iron reductase [Hygrophoropsis aurantiaca]